MLDFVEYGSLKIEYRIKWSLRKTLGISVLPCGSIEVSAPEGSGLDRIRGIVIKRSSWIIEQQRLTSYNPVPQPYKQLISGETLYYWGRQYRLKVFDSNYDNAFVLNDRIVLNCRDSKDFELKKSILFNWYSEQAIQNLTERFNWYATKYQQTELNLVVKKLSKSWGEFHLKSKTVVLNSELVVAPIECIDYVVTHELSHAIHLNHGPEFYSLLNLRQPRWKDIKNALEGYSFGFSLIDDNG